MENSLRIFLKNRFSKNLLCIIIRKNRNSAEKNDEKNSDYKSDLSENDVKSNQINSVQCEKWMKKIKKFNEKMKGKKRKIDKNNVLFSIETSPKTICFTIPFVDRWIEKKIVCVHYYLWKGRKKREIFIRIYGKSNKWEIIHGYGNGNEIQIFFI